MENTMRHLNYHHLQYFWTVAREGSIAKACEKLLLSQPTISGQLRRLERSVGGKLYERSGRKLVLTELGRAVYRYADEIFALGQELVDMIDDRPSKAPIRLQVGVIDSLPKAIAHRLIAPALRLPEAVKLVCEDGTLDALVLKLSTHELDVVLSDTPAGGVFQGKAFHHLLGECGLALLATPALAAKYRKKFPKSLRGAPFLLPGRMSAVRRELEAWLESADAPVEVRAEIDDSALMKAFAAAGMGIIAVPSAIEKEVRRQYRLSLVGRSEDVRQRFYVLSMERKLKHPAVVAIREAARAKLFD